MLPARTTFWCLKNDFKEIDHNPRASVLDWKHVQKHFQWDVLLLLGIIIVFFVRIADPVVYYFFLETILFGI